jgi:hypothetical protein
VTSSVRIRYRRFWPTFRGGDDFFARVVREATGRSVESVANPRMPVDLEITSVFQARSEVLKGKLLGIVRPANPSRDAALRWTAPESEPSANAAASLWFTGENIRPPASHYTMFASYDVDPLDGRNTYLPLWFTMLDWFGAEVNKRLGAEVRLQELLSPRRYRKPPTKFCCAFIGNDHPMRRHAISMLNRIAPVDVYGRAVGRPVPDKVAIASQYKFALCFENDVYPGYVTEKPFEAWLCGNIPLWWGSDPAGFIERKAVMNLAAYDGLEAFCTDVAEVNQDLDKWAERASSPLLARAPSLEPFKHQLLEALG